MSATDECDVLKSVEPNGDALKSTNSPMLFVVGEENSDRKSKKRKYRDKTSCEKKKLKLRSATDSSESMSDLVKPTSKEKCIKKHSSKRVANIDPVELKNVLEGMEEEIENALEERAENNKLTAANVKSILRHIITNEYVLAMVRNTMKAENSDGEELDEAVFEPKLTRSKAKELREKQHTLPWTVASPEKVSKKLLEEEFPDESSSDDDYDPNEEECPSEEEDVLSPTVCNSEPSSNLKTPPPSPDSKPYEEYVDDENALVIAFPDLDLPPNSSEADKIALRTRSKLCLNDTPLEEIEASFVAPDITVDLYDTNCDDEDWNNFLCELSKPIDTTVLTDEQHGEVDDAEDDPEYNFLEEEDKPDDFDLLYDKTVKVTREELNALMAEIMDSAQQELNDDDEEEDENRAQTPVASNFDGFFVVNVRSQWMNADERIQLDEQMRMYVQLLSQSYLLSFGIPELNFINVSSKLFLDEIKMFATREIASNNRSAFYAHNLDGALSVINEFESYQLPVHTQTTLKLKTRPAIQLPQVRQTLVSSKVFIYPELLPTCAYRRNITRKKGKFILPEDTLIALGLEQFSFTDNPVSWIHNLLVPSKTESQIKLRIKNAKSSHVRMDNPIKYFHLHKKAPELQRIVRIFDPENVKAPKDYPPEILPDWMKPYSKAASANAVSYTFIAPSQNVPLVTVVQPVGFKLPERRKYSPILPRLHCSPLKQISPILRKYSQQRRVVPFSGISPHKRKHVGFCNIHCLKPRIIQPKPFPKSITNNLSKKSGTVINCRNNSPVVMRKQSVISCNSGNSNRVKKKGILSVSSKHFNKNSTVSVAESLSSKDIDDHQLSTVLKQNEIEAQLDTEVCDEADEEVIDDEQDLAALMAASSTICKRQQSASKKRNRLQRDLESSLALLQPNLVENDPKKEEREILFTNSYLLRVTEALKGDTETCEKFLKALCKYQHNTRSPLKLYFELTKILKDHPALVNDFIAFLHPDEAKECGKYQEYIVLSKIREFVRKIEVHFSNQPQHLLRILRMFSQLRHQADITSSEVLSALQPLLRNQSHLMEELTHLLPDAPPPEYLMADFEEVTLPNSDEDNSSTNSCEEITVPDTPDPYGGKDCPCNCHIASNETRMLNRSRHCIKCGIKFIDGRIYIQTGKVLKPAQVIYHDLPPESTDQRKNGVHQTCPKAQQIDAAPKVITVSELSEQESSCAKRELSKTPSVIVNETPLHACADENPLPPSSRLPCDVIEDTVFPAVTISANKSVPPDFSHLKDMISHSKEKDNQNSIDKESSENCIPQQKKVDCQSDNPTASPSCTNETTQPNVWRRDEDKLIIYNCKRFGICKKAFITSASTLESRTAEEVEERFIELMKFLSKEIMKF